MEFTTASEQKIEQFISNHSCSYYDSYFDDNVDYQTFYQLSILRSGLYSWYEFKTDSTLLEIDGGYGALTGVFLSRCSKVKVTQENQKKAECIRKRYGKADNLEIYQGSIKSLREERFDYIVINGGLNKFTAASYLAEIRERFLKKDGTLLLAVDNRFGLRYLCGARDRSTMLPFDGLNFYPKGCNSYSFSRQELKELLHEVGFASIKFYYPLPDAQFPQLVYTDELLPKKNLKERLIPYYETADSLIAYELELYDDIVENGMFPFVANSFLVECSQSGHFSTVNYAAISTDRGEKNAFVTAIHGDGWVTKKELSPEGKNSRIQIMNHIMDLKNHGIPVVPHEMQQDGIVMPFIEAETYSNYIKKLFKENPEQVKIEIERLYKYILGSSVHIDATDNAMLTDETKELDWGVILKKAYIELIPLNCFYNKGDLLFFDQEFLRENYPAKYILFRALYYIYGFTTGAENQIPLSYFMQKYGLVELWSIFVEEENRFLQQIRNHKRYAQFYKWTKVNYEQMQANAMILCKEDGGMETYPISAKKKELFKVQMDLLIIFRQLCEKHGLTYFLAYGTLLGAVRHHGFIPWDDDIDVVMPRKDYEKLQEVAMEELEYPYFLQTPKNDSYFYCGYSRLRNSETTAVEDSTWGSRSNLGIWIDIIPLDYIDSDSKKNEKVIEKKLFYQGLLFAKTYGSQKEQMADICPFQWKWYRRLSAIFTRKFLCHKVDSLIRKCGTSTSPYVAMLGGYNRKPQRFYKEDFASTLTMEFEKEEFSVPVGWDRYLQTAKGKDYMTLPPVEKRVSHHAGVFKAGMPYKKFNQKYIDIFEDITDKTIVLFGSGMMFEHYMAHYGNKYTPTFLVDNDKNKWGSYRHGIEIKSPEALLEVLQGTLRLIICNIHYKEIEKQLKEMGIDDCRIYVQEKEWIFATEEKE